MTESSPNSSDLSLFKHLWDVLEKQTLFMEDQPEVFYGHNIILYRWITVNVMGVYMTIDMYAKVLLAFTNNTYMTITWPLYKCYWHALF